MPLFLIPILAGFRSALSAVLVFCSKPPGSWIAAAGALVIALWWFGHVKYAAGVAAAVAAASARSAQVRAKQTAAIAEVNQMAAVRAMETAMKDAKTQEAVEHVKEAAANMPGANGVVITSDVADRLRNIQ